MKYKIIPALIIATVGLAIFGGGYILGHQKTETERIEKITAAQTAPYPDLNAQTVASLVNQERLKAGIPALVYNPQLEASACAKATDMIAKNYWAHDSPDGTQPWELMDAAGYRYYKAAENLGYGQRSENQLITNWMNSPGHRKNIMDSGLLEQGICIKYGKFQGGNNAVIVNHFGARR